jgi:hypothetical protein
MFYFTSYNALLLCITLYVNYSSKVVILKFYFVSFKQHLIGLLKAYFISNFNCSNGLLGLLMVITLSCCTFIAFDLVFTFYHKYIKCQYVSSFYLAIYVH